MAQAAIRKLGELCEFRYGQFPTSGDLADDGEYPVFTGYRIAGRALSYHYKEPEIVVVARGVGGTGDVKMSPPKCFLTNLSIAVLPTSPEIEKAFLYYELSSRGLWHLRTGSAQAQITIERLREEPVRVPNLKVQRRVIDVAKTYDALIENCERRIRVLDEMARALYREWFVLFGYPGHEKTPLVDSALGRIPRDWEVVTLDDVCSRITDGAHASPKTVEAGLPMASSKDMHDWGLDLSTARQISESDFDLLVRTGCRPNEGDVLVTKDGANYLKRIFVLRDEPKAVLLSSIAILRAGDRISPSLLAASLRAPDTRARLKNYVTGAAIPRIVLKDFKAFQLALPPERIRGLWEQLGEPYDVACWKLSARVENLRRTRDLLLPRLLSGQLSVEDAA